MQLVRSISEYRRIRAAWSGSEKVGFVPTMGALHEGHASLVRRSHSENEHTVVSIFVNPTQFGPNEDFDKYPRTLEADLALLEKAGASLVFAPEREEVYPKAPAQISFSILDLDKKLDGASRPGHMNGVLQVVSILFNIIQPQRAYFGLKDYQQCLLIRQMVRELHFPLEVVPCAIVREADGLAMSSRNRYLNAEERQQARFLSMILGQIRDKYPHYPSVAELKQLVSLAKEDWPLVQLDYIEVLNGNTLENVQHLSPEQHPVAFIAAWLGSTRLIDNMPLYPQPAE
ncbi:MAG: pantoate--beta-alanine ligase [Bacteroidetes bacterium]|nr:MAG: pantoate--beta-alanine ligase [Bacteroidota bacterium]